MSKTNFTIKDMEEMLGATTNTDEIVIPSIMSPRKNNVDENAPEPKRTKASKIKKVQKHAEPQKYKFKRTMESKVILELTPEEAIENISTDPYYFEYLDGHV